MGNHDSYSDPSGGDYREGKQRAEGLFPQPARPMTLRESRRQYRSKRLLASGCVSLPACLTAQANPRRLRASAHRDDKKGCQRHQPLLSCQIFTGLLDPPRCTKMKHKPRPSSRPKRRDRAPSSGRMLGAMHKRSFRTMREACACASQTARDPSASVGMTERTADSTTLTFMTGTTGCSGRGRP